MAEDPFDQTLGGATVSDQTSDGSPTARTERVMQLAGAQTVDNRASGPDEALGDDPDSLTGPWEVVRQQAMAITERQRLEESPDSGPLPEAMKRYIRALCNPEVTTVVCQGGPGTGKTYTASLVGMLMLAAGLSTKMYHTKPLVSAGGQGLGYERGSVADKLAYWTRPTQQAAARVAEQQGVDAETLASQVEAFPIDRARGISVPKGEWMIADEMQNAYSPLFICLMTRAETGAKVVLCGDPQQSDLAGGKKPSGMMLVVKAYERLLCDAKDSGTDKRKQQAAQRARD
jgi:phosphate starvation-inducible protein PhoH